VVGVRAGGRVTGSWLGSSVERAPDSHTAHA